MKPTFNNFRTEIVYEILRRLYFIVIFSYLPTLFCITMITMLRGGGEFIDPGFWLPFLAALIVSLPILIFFVTFGMSVHAFWVMKTKNFHASLLQTLHGVSAVIYLLTFVFTVITIFSHILPKYWIVMLWLSIPALVTTIILYAAVKRLFRQESEKPEAPSPRISRIKAILTDSIIIVSVLTFLLIPYDTVTYDDGGTVMTRAMTYCVVDWNRTRYAEEEQHTCFYFFPENFKNYFELWDIRH